MKRLTLLAAVFLLSVTLLAGCKRGNVTPSTLPSTTGATLMPTTEATMPSTTRATTAPTTNATVPSTGDGMTEPTNEIGTTGTPNGTDNARGRRGMNRGY